MKQQKCSWITLLPDIIIGAEEDQAPIDKSGSTDSTDKAKEGAGSTPNTGSEEHDDENDPNVKGLKNALLSERKAHKAAQKELKAFQKAEEDRQLAEKTEVERLQALQEKDQVKLTKLAEGYLSNQLDSAIKTAASNKNFIDIQDALDGVDRKTLTYEQDPDDPSKVTIDVKSIEKAVGDLATRKPHYLKSGTDDGQASGSKFGAPQKKKPTSDEVLRQAYPSLS